MVPPGLSSRLRIANASTGRERCSRTKQTKTWSKDSASKGKAKMSACWNSTLVSPARSALRLASAIESAEISTEVKRASGLRWARVTVWAPTPHPDLEHLAPARVRGVGVQQVDQRTGLILQALVLPQVIAVYIRFAHGSTFVPRRRHVSNRQCRLSVGARRRAGPGRSREGSEWCRLSLCSILPRFSNTSNCCAPASYGTRDRYAAALSWRPNRSESFLRSIRFSTSMVTARFESKNTRECKNRSATSELSMPAKNSASSSDSHGKK